MSHFRPYDRDTPYLLPPSLDDWLPKNHLARLRLEQSQIGPLKDHLRERALRDAGERMSQPV